LAAAGIVEREPTTGMPGMLPGIPRDPARRRVVGWWWPGGRWDGVLLIGVAVGSRLDRASVLAVRCGQRADGLPAWVVGALWIGGRRGYWRGIGAGLLALALAAGPVVARVRAMVGWRGLCGQRPRVQAGSRPWPGGRRVPAAEVRGRG
jgi:hypothetical protein